MSRSPSKLDNNSGPETKKTFFKGATSLVMQGEPAMMVDKNDATIRGYLGIENVKHTTSRSQMNNNPSALDKALQDSGEDPLDPRHFTRSVLEQCKVVKPAVMIKKPMLHRGSSIARICDQSPSYAQAFAKTIYGKKNRITSVIEKGNKNQENFQLAPIGSDVEGMSHNHFHKRGRSVANALSPLKGIDFSAVSIDEDDKSRFGSRILTKFPPPPYLPGEIERREEKEK